MNTASSMRGTICRSRRPSPSPTPSSRFAAGYEAVSSGQSRRRVPHPPRNNRRFAMSQLQVAESNVAVDREAATGAASSAYVPPLQRTASQPPPFAANGGLSYMTFDRNGDAGTAAALEDA